MELDPIAQDRLEACLTKGKRCMKTGKLADALTIFEANLHEIPNRKVQRSWKLVSAYTRLCLKLAKRQIPRQECVVYLRKAEGVLQDCPATIPKQTLAKLRLLLCNTWASFHQATSNHRQAISYLLNAQKVSAGLKNSRDIKTLRALAKTKLNLAAMYMAMGRFRDAKEFSEQSLAVISAATRQNPPETKKATKGLISTMVIALYNIGAAEEAMQNFELAVRAFETACQLADAHLSATNHIALLARTALEEAQLGRRHSQTSEPVVPRLALPAETESSEFSSQPNTTRAKPVTTPTTTNKLKLRPATSREFSRQVSTQSVKHTSPTTKSKDKYFSERELFLLQRKMERQDEFISADTFFNRKIDKLLNMNQDIKYMDSTDAAPDTTTENWERRYLTELQLRRHTAEVKAPQHPSNYMTEKIEQMRLEEDERKRRLAMQATAQEKILASRKLRSSVGSDASTDSVDSLKRRIHETRKLGRQPDQRLFFKPPWQTDEPIPEPTVHKMTVVPKHPFQVAKEGIEKLMEETRNGVKQLDNWLAYTASEPANLSKPARKKRKATIFGKTQALARTKTQEAILDNPHMDLARSANKTNVKLIQYLRQYSRKRTTYMDLVSVIDRKRAKLEEIGTKRRSTIKPPIMFPKDLIRPPPPK